MQRCNNLTPLQRDNFVKVLTILEVSSIDGLRPKRSPGRSRQLSKSQEALVRKWFGAGVSNLEMARRLGVGETTVRRTLKRLGLRRTPRHTQRRLPEVAKDGEQPAAGENPVAEGQSAAEEAEPQRDRPVEVSSEPPSGGSPLPGSPTVDHDPRDRSGDRALARLGLLEDALPLFADAEGSPRAGVLLAVPLLVRHGLMEAFVNVYGSLRPSFYGLRTIVVTLFLAALLRIKRPEHFKEYRPEDLGAILGLDRAPEVKTVRRKFARLATMGRAGQLMEELARRRIAEDEDRVAFLYVDGHVREYHGKFPLFQAKKAQRQVVTPAATDNWVHDAAVKEKIDGVWREYTICDRPRVRVGRLPAKKTHRRKRDKAKKRYLWMREVRVLRDDGRQTPILTNRQDLSAVMVAYRIFLRWRQENYFKYMAEEFALDALAEYGAEDVPETIDCRNPQWLRLTRGLKEARAEVKRLESELGKEAEANAEAARPTMRGFKIAHAELREQLHQAEAKVEQLLRKRKNIPARIPACDRKMLKVKKKLIADTIKMAAYQVETQLLGMLQDHYARADDEGRTLLHAAFQSPARLEVATGELRVTIAAQSSPHRTAALSALCEQLDALAVSFPGTHLRLRLAVQAPEPVIS